MLSVVIAQHKLFVQDVQLSVMAMYRYIKSDNSIKHYVFVDIPTLLSLTEVNSYSFSLKQFNM